jgi:3'-phosphoadenosine 5'-phosphosulfate sulfotransferase (PAPS reductase)/FAD synthetase
MTKPLRENLLEYLTPSLKKYYESGLKINKALDIYLKNQKRFVDHTPILSICSVGIGQDSMTIIAKLVFDLEFRNKYAPGDLLLIFANTNSEHPYTYEYRDTVLIPFCKKHGLNFISIEPNMGYHPKNWQSLEHQWSIGTPSIGSLAFGKFANCTHNLKLTPQYNYVEDYLGNNYDIEKGTRKKNYKSFAKKYNKILWMIGISKFEEDRLFNVEKETKLWHKESINVVYPLIDIGYSRQDCQNYIKSVGLPIPFPSSCLMCQYGSVGLELLFMYYTYPDDFYKWVDYEQKKLDAYAGKTKEIIEYDAALEDPLTKKMIYINLRKVEKPIKNVGVVGKLHTKGPKKGKPYTLLDSLEDAMKKYQGITLDEINAYKFSHGHIGSVY